MSLAHLARRLLCVSAVMMIGAIAISVMTHDAWLLVGHVIGAASAVMAAIAVLAFVWAALRHIERTLPPRPPAQSVFEPFEQGLTGLEQAARAEHSSGRDEP